MQCIVASDEFIGELSELFDSNTRNLLHNKGWKFWVDNRQLKRRSSGLFLLALGWTQPLEYVGVRCLCQELQKEEGFLRLSRGGAFGTPSKPQTEETEEVLVMLF